jgi:hypothetical protein
VNSAFKPTLSILIFKRFLGYVIYLITFILVKFFHILKIIANYISKICLWKCSDLVRLHWLGHHPKTTFLTLWKCYIFEKFCIHCFSFVCKALCLWLTVMKTKSFSYNSLRSATGDFHPSSKIGGGGYGVVYKVRNRIRIITNGFFPYFLS